MERNDRDWEWLDIKDLQHATTAMYDWFESQDILPPDAIVVMTMGIVSLVNYGYQSKERKATTVNALINMIKEGTTDA